MGPGQRGDGPEQGGQLGHVHRPEASVRRHEAAEQTDDPFHAFDVTSQPEQIIRRPTGQVATAATEFDRAGPPMGGD